MEQMEIEIADERPILGFLCNPAARAKAVKTITALAMAADDRKTRLEILDLPIKKDSRVPKNILVAATLDDATVFTVNMKTGESHYE